MILALIILIIIIFLYIGIRISLSFGKTKTSIKIKIFKKITLYDSSKEVSKEEKEEENKKEYKHLIKPLKNSLPQLWNFLKKTTNAIKIHKLDAHLKFGLASYADTAKYIGYIWAAIGFINSLYPVSKLSAEPVFGDPITDFKGDINIDINLLKLIPPAISLIAKKEVRDLIKAFRCDSDDK